MCLIKLIVEKTQNVSPAKINNHHNKGKMALSNNPSKIKKTPVMSK